MRGGRARRDREPPADLTSALEIAFRYLATRPRSRAEITRRLRRDGTDDALVEATLGRLEQLGYVDDGAFVRYWTEQRDLHAPRGRALLEAELRSRGIHEAAIRAERERSAAATELRDPDPGTVLRSAPEDVEQARADAALAGHLRGRRLDPADRAAMRRAAGFLARRGFDAEVSRDAVRRVVAARNDASDEDHDGVGGE